MFGKISVVFVVALAVTAQAGHGKHHHAKRHYGPGYGAVSANTTAVVPQSTPSISPVPVSSGTAPAGTSISGSLLPSRSVPIGTSPGASQLPSSSVLIGTGPSASQLPSSSIPLGTGFSASQLPSSSVPLGTGPSASQFPSSSIPLGTGPSAPFPYSSGSLSASQNPSSRTAPSGAGVTGAPGKVLVVTSDSVLTYTVGSGSSTTVVVTTIHHTRTSTVVETIYASKSSSTNLAPTAAPNSPEGPTGTKKSYVTSTNVITVYPVPATEAPVVGQTHINVVGSDCPAQVTVTVPGPQVTVTVTATPLPESSSGPKGSATEAPSSRVEASAAHGPTPSALPSLSSSALYKNGTNTEANTRRTKTNYASTEFLTRTSLSFTDKPTATSIVSSAAITDATD